jgi:2-polyprenyl-3-methyl-5-hydroxy-6-metoxy-1,4-benzoquinol methylase
VIAISGDTAESTLELFRRRGELPLESVPCYLCGRTDGPVLVNDPPFQVRSCAGCGLGYVTPRIRGERIQEIYDLGYFTSESAGGFGYTSYAADAPGYLRTFKKKVAIMRRFVPSGRVLEIGCAAGFFLAAARDAGYEAHGIEVAGSILAHARDVLKLGNLFHGTLAEYRGVPRSFDAIAMWDVVEHLADPVADLKRARPLLKDGGFLLVQTQDVDSMTRRVLGARWHHFKQLEHIYHFSKKTMPALLDRAGFEVVDIRKSGAGKYISMGFFIDRMKRFGKIPHLLALPLSPLRRRFLYVNPWDELIVIARAKTG